MKKRIFALLSVILCFAFLISCASDLAPLTKEKTMETKTKEEKKDDQMTFPEQYHADELAGKGFYSVYGGKVAAENDDELCYYVRGAKDAWIEEIAAETWGDAVVTKPVTVEAMHQWLANNPDAFIAAFQA